jgi:hypothetical protein
MMRLPVLIRAIFLPGLFITAAGCGRTVPVEGTVTLDGKPIDYGTITFIPFERGKPAVSPVIDGKFKLNTHGKEAGAMRGKFKVVISKPQMQGVNEPGAGKELLPQSYSNTNKTILTYEVTEKDYEVRFDLNSQGTKP